MAARPGGGGGARPVPATAAAASLPAASRLPVRKAHAKRAAAAPEPEAPEQGGTGGVPVVPGGSRFHRSVAVTPPCPPPGLLRKAMTVAAAPQAGKKAPGAASGSAAPPPVPGVRRRAAGDPRGQLAELREKIRGLEDDNRQLREQLQHSRAREEELEGQVLGALSRREAEVSELRALAGAQEEHLHALEMERRRLHNQLQELKGNIRVFCCVRPLLAAEQEAQKGLEHLHFPPEDNKTLVLCRTEGSHTGRRGEVRYDFSFDRVFPPGASQEDVFEEIALLVQSALDGYPVCIFAYGQTGSGKTYTMEGPGGADPTSWGVIPRAVRAPLRGRPPYSFSASFLEIYNEALRDLLGGDRGGELEIRHVSSASKELHVPNLRCVPVASEDEVRNPKPPSDARWRARRSTTRSSRSHCVFQLHIQGLHASRALRCSSSAWIKCQASGQRLRETQAINSSLATLGLVIMAISNKEPHVPYRNSKLTYLLQNSLRGQRQMLMFVNISPLEENFAESLNSLRCVGGARGGERGDGFRGRFGMGGLGWGVRGQIWGTGVIS
uniref:Kinesin motor domain-containing protein n=1 Tax=Anas platyrhynchos TaxID=8839 RepID=A0A8B9QY69_ANAPL